MTNITSLKHWGVSDEVIDEVLSKVVHANVAGLTYLKPPFTGATGF